MTPRGSKHVAGKLIIFYKVVFLTVVNPLNAKLNPISHLLALLGAHHILRFSRIRANLPYLSHLLLEYLTLEVSTTRQKELYFNVK